VRLVVQPTRLQSKQNLKNILQPFNIIVINRRKTFKNTLTMNSLLYVIAVILVIGWAVAFFFTTVGSLIHVLLVIAVIALLLGVIRRPTAL
jgi:uncharacterized membrane protein (DUF485 family)